MAFRLPGKEVVWCFWVVHHLALVSAPYRLVGYWVCARMASCPSGIWLWLVHTSVSWILGLCTFRPPSHRVRVGRYEEVQTFHLAALGLCKKLPAVSGVWPP